MLLRKVLLLAGGQSSRMGVAKGLLDFKGQPWLLEQMDRLKKVRTTHLILVLGYCAEEYLQEIPGLREALSPAKSEPFCQGGMEFSVRINPQPQLGSFSSLMEGIQANRETGSFSELFLLPIDVPCPELSVWTKLQEALSAEVAEVQVAFPSYQGRGGHPVLLSERFQEKLFHIPLTSPEARLDSQIRALIPSQKRGAPVDDREVLMNLNSPREWNEYLAAT